jgi:hypothetical protein
MLTRSNYEPYFLDYHEGTLNAAQRREVLDFLEQNPDLKEEFFAFESIRLESASDTVFAGKNNLKKGLVSADDLQNRMVAYFEGDLSVEEKRSFEAYLKEHPTVKRELEILKQTRLIPDHRIIFEKKASLRRGGKVIAFSASFYRSVAVAASIVLFFIAFFIYRNQHELPMVTEKHAAPAIQAPVAQTPLKREILPSIKNEKGSSSASHHKELKVEHRPAANLASRSPKSPEKNNSSLVQETVKSPEPGPLATNATSSSEIQSPENLIHQEGSASTIAQVHVIRNDNYSKSDLSQIFSEDEMNELGLEDKPSAEKKSLLGTIAEKGAEKLSADGAGALKIKREENEADHTTTYALAIGKFAMRRTTSK